MNHESLLQTFYTNRHRNGSDTQKQITQNISSKVQSKPVFLTISLQVQKVRKINGN